MALDQSEVQRGGDLLVYLEPYASGNVMPTDSAWGTAWGGSFVNEGYSDGGVDLNIAFTYDPQHVDQSLFPIFTIATAGEIHLVASLLQTTPQRLAKVLGQGTVATVAASSGVRGHTDLLIDGTLGVTRLTGGYDVRQRSDLEGLRMLLWNAQAVGSQALKFVRTAPAPLALDLQGYPDDLNSGRILTYRDISAALP